jgi:hypothetical protein
VSGIFERDEVGGFGSGRKIRVGVAMVESFVRYGGRSEGRREEKTGKRAEETHLKTTALELMK